MRYSNDVNEILVPLHKYIFSLNEENIIETAKYTMGFYYPPMKYSYHWVICNLVLQSFVVRRNDFNIYFNFLKQIDAIQKEFDSEIDIFNMFANILRNSSYSCESNYLIQKLIDQNLLQKEFTNDISNLYFIHYKTPEEIQKLKSYSNAKSKAFFNDYEKLSKDNWALHKKYVSEGVNPNEIATIIRNDEVEKLQNISSNIGFDFNQMIPPSVYERCTIVDGDKISLINYAAFYGAIKCFRFLLQNGGDVKDTARFAIAGGNVQIFHLCEQNNSTFDLAYETAVEYNQRDLLIYITQNNLGNFIGVTNLLIKSILYFNFDLYTSLESGSPIDEGMHKQAARMGNTILLKYLNAKRKMPRDILPYAAGSGNVETIKFIIENDDFDINAKDIFLYFFMFNGNFSCLLFILFDVYLLYS